MVTLTDAPPIWHSLVEPATPEAVVIFLCEPSAIDDARQFADRWSGDVPRSAFSCVEIVSSYRQIAFAPVRDLARRELARLGLATAQVVLVGFGASAQRVLDLMLCNVLESVHAVVVDLPSGGIVISLPPPQGTIRFVRHRRDPDEDARPFEAMLHVLRESAVDLRSIVVPDEPDVTSRAVGSFLVELVALASRARSIPRAPVGVSFQTEGRS